MVTFYLDSVKHKTQSPSGQVVLSHSPSGYYELRFAADNTNSSAFLRGYASSNKLVLTGTSIELSGTVTVNGAALGVNSAAGITGNGTFGYLSKFTSTSGIGNSIVSESGNSLNIRCNSTSGALNFADETGIKLYLGKVGSSAMTIEIPDASTMRFNSNGQYDFRGATVFSGSFSRLDLQGTTAELRFYLVGSDDTSLHLGVRKATLPACSYLYSVQGLNSGVFQSWGDLVLGGASTSSANKVVIGRTAPTYITSSGLGINRPNPTATLDVSGSGKFLNRLDVRATNSSLLNTNSLLIGDVSNYSASYSGRKSEAIIASTASDKTALRVLGASGQTESIFSAEDAFGNLVFTVTNSGVFASGKTLRTNMLNHNRISGNYSVISSDDVILASGLTTGHINVFLPSAATVSGQLFRIKRLESGAFNLVVSGNTIDGETGVYLPNRFQSLSVISDGSVYYTY